MSLEGSAYSNTSKEKCYKSQTGKINRDTTHYQTRLASLTPLMNSLHVPIYRKCVSVKDMNKSIRYHFTLLQRANVMSIISCMSLPINVIILLRFYFF
jgi:hypothetical protein